MPISVGNVASFRIPDSAGRAGGACTSTLLSIVYKDHEDTASDLTYKQVIDGMRGNLEEKNFKQIPQVSSLLILDVFFSRVVIDFR